VVGLVFQDPATQLVMDRAGDDVAFGLESRAWPRAAMLARVPEALAEAGLEGLRDRRSMTLSGGQQQRLALAGVLAPRPDILVLDEPTANLDPPGAAAFMARLAAIRRDRSATIVLVEHRVDLAWPFADAVLALGRDGSPIDLGPPAEVLARSGRRLVAEGVWLPRDAELALGVEPAGPFAARTIGPELVAADRVSFGYGPGRPAVDDASIRVAAGERVVLVGPNGSGKSTLGRLLVGLLRPDSGRVRLGGDDPVRLRSAVLARRAGYVFQDPEAQFLATTVGDEVGLGLLPAEQARVAQVMDSLGLPLGPFGDRSPYALSGGEGRRLSLACILVRRPGLLVLDEPTFGQDRRGYGGLLTILRERVEEGTAIVAATHDLRLVEDLATRVIAMDDGRLDAPAAAA
jgi:energy-coupling factor transporter ATP-binding protein EcfA2